MPAGKIALAPVAALLCSLAAGAGGHEARATNRDQRSTSALVLRASAPLEARAGHGEASFQGHLCGRSWHVALAWSSAGGAVRVGAAIASQPSE